MNNEPDKTQEQPAVRCSAWLGVDADDDHDDRPLGDWCRVQGWEGCRDCPDCDGDGMMDFLPCETCGGDGIIDW